jgi:photosystem II stability/assembly factor-like uncharacterized protein
MRDLARRRKGFDMRRLPLLLLFAALLPLLRPAALAEEAPAKAADAAAWVSTLRWRPIGPATMGGRITALAVVESDPEVWWAATASGGLLKTEDDGISFVHQLDREKTVSIGDVAVAPSDPNVVWVGMGEANPRNSVSWGDGVYRSGDGGKTWKNVGLRDAFQIGAVVVHPEKADVVWVGALGRLWGPSQQRGLYRTVDGGKTWERQLFVDEKTGVVDVAMHPEDPDTLLVATYERQRDGFDTNDPAKRWGPGSGLWRTTDGGKTFTRITEGLPGRPLGRIGIAHARSAPDVVYAIVESEWVGAEPESAPYMGITGQDADVGARLTRVIPKGPAAKAGLKDGDIVLGLGDVRIHSYAELIRFVRSHEAGDEVPFEVVRDRKSLTLPVKLAPRPRRRGVKGPTRERSMFAAGLGGQRANLQDQQGRAGHEFGGLYRSEDGGATWARVNTVNPRPMYFSEVRVDPTNPERVYVLGIRLWVSEDGGKTFEVAPARGVHVDHHAMWIDPEDPSHMILGNDGGVYTTRDRGAHWDHLNHVAIGQFYHVGVGPRRAYLAYGGLQDNGSWGGPSLVRHGRGPANADWFRIGGGDGFVCRVDPEDPDALYFESQYGAMGRWNIRTGERGSLRPRAPRGTRWRFNWNTPYVLSHHNPRIVYAAGNVVFRSLDRGRRMRVISPEITATKRGSATALAESPRDPDLLWVGTDDGALWISRNGGHEWTDLFTEYGARHVTPGTSVTATQTAPAPSGTDAPEAKDAPAPTPAAEKRAAKMVEAMMRRDADGDGKLQASELPWRGRTLLKTADANGDGGLDAGELRKALFRGRRREAAPAKAPAPAVTTPAPEEAKEAPAATPRPGSLAALVPERRWVAWIEPSRYVDGRCYLVLDGHRSDDDRPHVYATEDHGKTWRSLRANLPDDVGTTRVLREDLVNPDLLYLGTELGAWVSLDRGASWTSLATNLPTVAVHAFALHRTVPEIVAATHGRSLWVLDVSALRQMTSEARAAPVHLFAPRGAVHWRPMPGRGSGRTYVGENPASGATIRYALARKAKAAALRIETLDGRLVRELAATVEPGLHAASWDLRWRRPEGRRVRYGPRAKPGTYRVVLTVDGEERRSELLLEMDPEADDERWLAMQDEAEEAEARYREDKDRRRNPWRYRGED